MRTLDLGKARGGRQKGCRKDINYWVLNIKHQAPIFVGSLLGTSLDAFRGKTYTPNLAEEQSDTRWGHRKAQRMRQKGPRRAEKVVRLCVSSDFLLCLLVERRFCQ